MARAPGRLRHAAAEASELPAVGDWVTVDLRPGMTPTLRDQLERTTCFVRKAAGRTVRAQVVAANIDLALLVMSANRDFSVRRLERYLALTVESGAEAVVVLTKVDLCESVDALLAEVRGVAGSAAVHVTSALDGSGVMALRHLLATRGTGVLLGSSGAGKSTLANALLGQQRFTTGSIREDDDRGRHTTTRRELVALPGGGVLIDTPGMRELGLWGTELSGADSFGEVEELAAACRFFDCTHTAEPGCAVVAAVNEGALDAERLEAYRRLRAEQRDVEARATIAGQLARKAQARTLSKAVREVTRGPLKRGT